MILSKRSKEIGDKLTDIVKCNYYGLRETAEKLCLITERPMLWIWEDIGQWKTGQEHKIYKARRKL